MTNKQNKNSEQKQTLDPDFEGFDDMPLAEKEEGDSDAVTASQVPPGLEHPSYQELQALFNEMEAKANENWDKLLRMQAEMENQRRRAERDVANAHKYALEKFVQELLPVIDSLEQGLQMTAEGHESVASLREGMELTLKMLLSTLEKFGVKQLNPAGEVFNPIFHEVMTAQPQEGMAPNTIIMVLQKGYELNDRLIRPARVIVAK